MIVSNTNLVEYLKSWISGMMKATHSDGLVFAMTGGVDSSVLAALCLGIRPPVPMTFIFMGFKPDKEELFQKWASKTFPHVTFTSITPTHPSIPEFNGGESLGKALISSYMTFEASRTNSLAISAVTKSEYRLVKAIGPDVFGAYPFIDLYRSEILQLGRFLEVPGELLEASSIYQESLGITFEELEWLDRENDNTGILSSNEMPTTSRFWGIYGQRQKQVIAQVYSLTKSNKHLVLPEAKSCLVRKFLPGVVS